MHCLSKPRLSKLAFMSSVFVIVAIVHVYEPIGGTLLKIVSCDYFQKGREDVACIGFRLSPTSPPSELLIIFLHETSSHSVSSMHYDLYVM